MFYGAKFDEKIREIVINSSKDFSRSKLSSDSLRPEFFNKFEQDIKDYIEGQPLDLPYIKSRQLFYY